MFENLDQVLDDIAARLSDGAANRRSPMHIPVVGTADADLRMMVLRGFDPESWTARFHTDARSPKTDLIGTGGAVSLLFHDAEAKIQVRAKGQGRIETTGLAADDAWAQSTNFAKRCYLATNPPGTVSDAPVSGLPDWAEGIQPSDEQVAPARRNFAVLLIAIEHLDWLYLANKGHRRAQFDIASGDQRWAVP